MSEFHHLKVKKDTGEVVEFFVQGYPPPEIAEDHPMGIYPVRPEDMPDSHIIQGQIYNFETMCVEDTQISKNIKAENTLKETDWIIQRHMEQKELGVETKMSEDQYKQLLTIRQELRESII